MKAKVSPKDNKIDYLRKTARTKYSPDQVRALEGLFISCQYPDTEVLQAISDKLAVSIEKVSIWFQNRRAKFKRQSKNAHTAWMRQQLFNQDNVIRPTTKTDPEMKKHILTPPEAPTKDCVADLPSSNLHYGSIQAYHPGFSPELYAYQQYAYQEFYRNASEPAYGAKPLSVNDLVHELSQNQYNANYTSQSTANNQSTCPPCYSGNYPPVYYPYSVQYPYGAFPPIGV